MNWLSDANQAAQRATAPAEHSELTMLRQFNGFTYIPQLTVDSAEKIYQAGGRCRALCAGDKARSFVNFV